MSGEKKPNTVAINAMFLLRHIFSGQILFSCFSVLSHSFSAEVLAILSVNFLTFSWYIP